MNHVPEVRRIEVVDPAMAEVYRRKTPAERIAMIFDANETMRLLIAGRLRTDHPDWDDERISQEVARRMLYGFDDLEKGDKEIGRDMEMKKK